MSTVELSFRNSNINSSVPFSLENLILMDHSVKHFRFYDLSTTKTMQNIVDNSGFNFLHSKEELRMWFKLLIHAYNNICFIYDSVNKWYTKERTLRHKYVSRSMPFMRSKIKPYPDRRGENYVEGARIPNGISLVQHKTIGAESFRNYTVSDLFTIGILNQYHYDPFEAIKEYVESTRFYLSDYTRPYVNTPCTIKEYLACNCLIDPYAHVVIGERLVLARYHRYVLSKYMKIIKNWLNVTLKSSNVNITVHKQPRRSK